MKKSQQKQGFKSLVLTNYHSCVYGRQKIEKRILTNKEKIKIYKDFVNMFNHSPFC